MDGEVSTHSSEGLERRPQAFDLADLLPRGETPPRTLPLGLTFEELDDVGLFHEDIVVDRLAMPSAQTPRGPLHTHQPSRGITSLASLAVRRASRTKVRYIYLRPSSAQTRRLRKPNCRIMCNLGTV